MYRCMCMLYVHFHACVYVQDRYTCVEVRSQCQVPFTYHSLPYFFETGLWLARSLPIRLAWLISKSQRLSCVCFLSIDYRCTLLQPALPKYQRSELGLEGKLYWLSISPVTRFLFNDLTTQSTNATLRYSSKTVVPWQQDFCLLVQLLEQEAEEATTRK